MSMQSLWQAWPWFVAAGLVFALAVSFVAGWSSVERRRARRREAMRPVALTEWRPTGVIDMIAAHPEEQDEDKPDLFFLMSEEKREVSNIAGHAIAEQRWRFASRAEAKDVVRAVVLARSDRRPVNSAYIETKPVAFTGGSGTAVHGKNAAAETS